MAKKPHINLIFVGHIDHGKSTLIGRLFFETGALSQQELDKFKKKAEELGKVTWEFAYFTDATEQERKRGVTIELSHKKFSTPKYEYTIIDAPGHKDFVKNMITGASQADAAVLVVAASDGVMVQTKEHLFLCRTLGVKQMIVAINKMDVVKHDEKRYNEVVADLKMWLKNAGYNVDQIVFIPTSAIDGSNIAKPSDKTPWYKGPTLLGALDNITLPEKPVDLPLRVPVQDVYTITGIGTVPVGRVETGVLKVNQKVVFMPSNKTGEIKSIEMHHETIPQAEPGDNIGFNVRGIGKGDISRGDVCSEASNPATVAKEFEAQILVLDHPTVITEGYTPVFHCHTAQVACKFKKLLKKLDPRTGTVKEENPEMLRKGDAAIVLIEPTKPMAIEEKAKIPQLSSFAIRDMGRTIGAGMCIKVTQSGV